MSKATPNAVDERTDRVDSKADRETALEVQREMKEAARRGLSLMSDPSYEGPNMVAMFDVDDPEARAELFNVVAGEVPSMKDFKDEAFNLKRWAVKREWTQLQEQDSPQWNLRLILWDAEHGPVFTFAQSIRESLEMLISLFGCGPYEPPIPVSITQIKTGKNRKWYRMTIRSTVVTPATK